MRAGEPDLHGAVIIDTFVARRFTNTHVTRSWHFCRLLPVAMCLPSVSNPASRALDEGNWRLDTRFLELEIQPQPTNLVVENIKTGWCAGFQGVLALDH